MATSLDWRTHSDRTKILDNSSAAMPTGSACTLIEPIWMASELFEEMFKRAFANKYAEKLPL